MGPLPFSERVEVREQGGNVLLADVGCSPAWPQGSSTNSKGKAFDHRCQIERRAWDVLDGPNRSIRYPDGTTYKIVDRERHDFVPHVELELRAVKGG